MPKEEAFKSKIIGHRGAMGEYPENTLGSIELALKKGCDGVEIDVHLSLDAELVVIHDSTLMRTTKEEGLVKEKKFYDLRKLDAGNGEKIPSLEVNTLNDTLWSIDDYLDKAKYMIVFYRGLHCPVCSDFLKQIDNQLLEYKNSNTEVIAISMDTKETVIKAESTWGIANLNIAYGLTEK